jgi:hypothetical protein
MIAVQRTSSSPRRKPGCTRYQWPSSIAPETADNAADEERDAASRYGPPANCAASNERAEHGEQSSTAGTLGCHAQGSRARSPDHRNARLAAAHPQATTRMPHDGDDSHRGRENTPIVPANATAYHVSPASRNNAAPIASTP